MSINPKFVLKQQSKTTIINKKNDKDEEAYSDIVSSRVVSVSLLNSKIRK